MTVPRKKAARWIYLVGTVSCAATISLFPVARLLAQAPDAASAAGSTAAPGDTDQLQEVTVSAERRSENLQSVPIVVDTLSASQMQAMGVTNVESLVSVTPNVSFITASNATNVYIRGVGDSNASVNNEPSTATYVDGVYYAQAQALTSFNFNNIDHIEVLEGPQGTLFGRNATAGVIQIITPDPKQEVSGKVEGGYGNYGTVNADAYLTGGLTDKLSVDVSLLGVDQMDGYGHYLLTGEPTYLQKAGAVRSKWLYDVSNATQIRFVADYENFDSGGIADQYVPISAGLGPAQGAAYYHYPYAGMYNNWSNFPWLNDNIQYGAALTFDHDFGSVTHFQSISSYRWVSGLEAIDGDISPESYQSVLFHYDSHYVTQEFHLTNQNPGRITWLIGAFYYGNEVYGSDPRLSYGTGVAHNYEEFTGDQNVASGSLFAQTTAEIIDQTKLTLGVRYTDETIKAFTNTRLQTGALLAGPFDNEIRADPLTWRASLDHQFTADVMGYVSYDKGYKSGGYNLSSPGSAPFYPEHVDAYEFGMKSEFLDHRLRFNLSSFYYHYKDIQTQVALGGTTLFVNAASAQNYGLDESLDFVATPHLTFSTGVGLLSAKYLNWPSTYSFNPAGVKFIIGNASGADLPYSPTSSAVVSANYHDLVTSVGTFHATASVSYKDRAFLTPDMGLEIPTYFMLDATLEWRPLSDNSWAVQLWGRNLTDATTVLFGTESSIGWYVAYGAPRTYGIKIVKDFK